MKQLLPLFLFLLPCLALAQYPSNGNQKITLGEQTTADGLIYRGVAATDTVRKPSIDTMAYMVLDTTTNIMWHYKKATSNAWLRLNLLPSDTASMLTPYWRAGRFSGVLPLLNGGTGSATKNFVDLTTTQSIGGAKTLTSALTGTSATFNVLNLFEGLVTSGVIAIQFRNSGLLRWEIDRDATESGSNAGSNLYLYRFDDAGGYLGTAMVINRSSGSFTLGNLAGSGIRTVEADANGVLSAPVSSINSKQNVQTLNYGLNELLQINPVSFDYINKDKWGEERNLGFIVEDMYPVIPEVTGTMNNGDMYLDMTKLIPVLTKAIQEQNSLIKALEQRIINLENK
jgi:hypothetical protein